MYSSLSVHHNWKCIRTTHGQSYLIYIPLPTFHPQTYHFVHFYKDSFNDNHYIINMCLSCFGRVRLFATLWIIARQAPLSMGIFQARILECVAVPSSRESSWPRDGIHVSFVTSTAGGFFTNKPLEKPLGYDNLMALCLGECILLCLLSLDVCVCDFPWI